MGVIQEGGRRRVGGGSGNPVSHSVELFLADSCYKYSHFFPLETVYVV